MIRPISSFSNGKTNNNFTNSKQSTQVAFSGNFTKLGTNLVTDEGSQLGGKIRRFAQEASESLGRTFRKLTGKNELPVTEKPLTANGTITHFAPDGTPITIKVPDSEIKNPGADGANIYTLDGNEKSIIKPLGEVSEIGNESNSIKMLNKAGQNIDGLAESAKPEPVDYSKVVFGPDDMPITDAHGNLMQETDKALHNQHSVDVNAHKPHLEPIEVPPIEVAPAPTPDPYELSDLDIYGAL